MKVPAKMPDVVAAAFSIGAQTAYSMLRRLDPPEGSNVLVTAAKSNVSLFIINALKDYPVEVYATTTSMRFEEWLGKMGVKELIQVDPMLESFADNKQIEKIVSRTGGFDCVVDPFFDLHIGKVVDVMALDGKYITCGLYDQHLSLTGKKFRYRGRGLHDIMTLVFAKNSRLIGNCLGQTEDLSNAIRDYAAGSFDVVIDPAFNNHSVGAFFDKTYNATDRFGKVVYQYSCAD